MRKIIIILLLLLLSGCTKPVVKEQLLGGTGTLGNIHEGDVQVGLTKDTIRTWEYTMSENGTATKISVYLKKNTVDPTKQNWVRGVIYLASDKSLLSYSPEVTLTDDASYHWFDLDITDVALSSGVAYRIGMWFGGTVSGYNPYYAYDSGVTMYRDDYTYHPTDVPHNPFVDDSSVSDRKASIYVTYTQTGGGANTCTYSGSGNWNVLQTDNCYVTSTVYVNGDFNLIGNAGGTGSFGCASGVKVSATAFNLGSGKTHFDTKCFAHH